MTLAATQPAAAKADSVIPTTMPMLTVETPEATNGYDVCKISPVVTVSGGPNGYDLDQPVHVVTVSKLSRLQKHILHLALENRSRESRDEKSKGADLYYAEIMAAHFGFKPECYKDLREEQGSHRFHPEEIGRGKYAAASAAISRAAKRLQTRGLIVWMNGVYSHWSGVSLTPEGIKAALAGARRGDERGQL